MTKYLVLAAIAVLAVAVCGIKYGCYGRSGHGRDIPPEEISITVE